MSSFFGKSEPTEFVFDDDEVVEPDPVVNESVEVPEKVEPDVTDVPAEKADRRGKAVGGSDYTFYGDF